MTESSSDFDGAPRSVGRSSIDQNRKVELAKALKQIRVAIPEHYEAVRQSLQPPELREATERAVAGLTEEDEFGFMCRLMGSATHLVKFDQSPVLRGESIAPDYLARFQPAASLFGRKAQNCGGFRCLVEVKSTEDPKCTFKLGGSLLRRRREFADTFGLPLILAVRFLRLRGHAVWVVVEDDRSRSSIRVGIPEMTTGIQHVIWDDYGYLLDPRVYFVAVYDSASGADGVRHERYGVQTEYRIMRERDVLFRMEQPDATLASALFESFDPTERQTQQKGTITYQALSAANSPIATAFLPNTIYRMNCLATRDDGSPVHDAARIAAGLAEPFFTRPTVEALCAPFLQAGVLMYVGIGLETHHLEVWKRFGGSPSHEVPSQTETKPTNP